MSNKDKGKIGLRVLIGLMIIVDVLQYTVFSDYAATTNSLVTTLAGMAVVEAVTCFEDGTSIGIGIIVVALVLFILEGPAFFLYSQLAGALVCFIICILFQMWYFYWRR